MKNKLFFHLFTFRNIGLALSPIIFLGLNSTFLPCFAQEAGTSALPAERDINTGFVGGEQEGTILDATNPMELINRLRRATAMEDATPPSDAIDEALKAWESDDSNGMSETVIEPL